MRKIAFLLTAFFLFTSHFPVFAARSFIVESYKQSFINDEEGEVVVRLDGFNNSEQIFIKGAFSPPDSSNYFGYTKKGDGWVKNSATTTNQLSIKIDDWDSRLIVKPDLTDTGFHGTGNYNFKVGFYYYSGTGSLSSVNWSDIQTVNITFVPTPTPTPIPTSIPIPIPTCTQTNTPAPTVPTKPKPSATTKPQPKITANTLAIPTNTPIAILTSKLLDKSIPILSPGSQSNEILGDFASKEIILDKEIAETTKSGSRSKFSIFVILLLGGLICFIVAVVICFRQINRRKV